MIFDLYSEYNRLVRDGIDPLIEKGALSNTTKHSFERSDKAIKNESQIAVLGSDQHEILGKLAHLPDNVQYKGAEILIGSRRVSRNASDSQSDRTKIKRILIPGPGIDFFENRRIASLDFTPNTFFCHEAVDILQNASYVGFEIRGRVDADHLKRIQSALALCRTELPYGVIQAGTESVGSGELSKIVNANRRDFENFFGHPIDYYILGTAVDGFGMVETDLLTTLRSVEMAKQRGIAANALSAGILDVGNALLSTKAALDHIAAEKQTRERYDTAVSKRIDFQKTIMVGSQSHPNLKLRRKMQEAGKAARHQIFRDLSSHNGSELFARLKTYIHDSKVNPRRKKKVKFFASELEKFFSDGIDKTWLKTTEGFQSEIMKCADEICRDLILDAVHKWGVPEERVSFSISPQWTDDGPDTTLNVDLDVAVLSSRGEVIFRLVISTSVFSVIGGFLGPIGYVIGGLFGLILGYGTLIDADRRNFKRHIEGEIRNALSAASHEMSFQFDILMNLYSQQADDVFGEMLAAIIQDLDDKLSSFTSVPSLSVDELDQKIRDQSQIETELESLQQEMIALRLKLSDPPGAEPAAAAVG